MKIINGTSFWCSDQQLALNEYNSGYRVVCFSDEANEIKAMMPEAIMASIFLPPYELMDILMDGDMQTFSYYYTEYLATSEEVNTMIDIILAALYKGINIVFYVPRSEFELGFWQIFNNYFVGLTGVIPGIMGGNPQNVDYLANNPNIMRLFSKGFMDYPDLLTGFDGPITDPILCVMMCERIGFSADPEYAIQYINSYKASIENNNGIFLQKGIVRV